MHHVVDHHEISCNWFHRYGYPLRQICSSSHHGKGPLGRWVIYDNNFLFILSGLFNSRPPHGNGLADFHDLFTSNYALSAKGVPLLGKSYRRISSLFFTSNRSKALYAGAKSKELTLRDSKLKCIEDPWKLWVTWHYCFG